VDQVVGMSGAIADLASVELSVFARVHTVLTDIDDTLTSEGRLTSHAYAALERLDAAGFRVIPLTGRPAGWCDLIARLWPVAAVVGENGAFAFRYDRAVRRMHRIYERTAADRAVDQVRLGELGQTILAQVPGAAIAADQPFRIADLAIDVREDVAPLAADAVGRIVDLFRAAGATAKVSSIHVNGWFGSYDKLSMTKRLLAQEFQLTIEDDSEGVVFVGDSPNDEPLFAAAPLSVGVANVAPYLAQMSSHPRFITASAGGAGFAELAETLLAARARDI